MIRARNIALCASLAWAADSHAQRASENALAEASDAFGTVVGREEIGLYSAQSARGFSPSQAGNLRIDDLYFDQVNQAKPVSRIVRSSAVHVGISAQGFPFPAPTGVVNFHLRTPEERAAGGGLLGIASYDEAYAEFDYQTPLIGDVLSVGGGAGYMRNPFHEYADRSTEWNVGGVAAWQPNPALSITPFWSRGKQIEDGEKSYVFIGDAGYADYHSDEPMAQPWARWSGTRGNYGTTARLTLAHGWRMEAGVFRSEQTTHFNQQPLLVNIDSTGEGDYSISSSPARSSGSTSGEVRVTKQVSRANARNTFYGSVKGRHRRGESGGSQIDNVGRANLYAVPQIARPAFEGGPLTTVRAEQVTIGIGYDGVLRDVGQLSMGVQKSFYERTVSAPGAAEVSGSDEPWLYNIAAAANLSRKLVAYASFTRGFEEIGSAPLNAVNRDEAVPAQSTKQSDAGFRYALRDDLALVMGVFEIEKPYFDTDDARLFRAIGTTRNRGIEMSLAGEVGAGLSVVAGVILLDPTVTYATAEGSRTRDAIGPVPGLIRANLQYRVPAIDRLRLEMKIENTSSRWARYGTVRLPAVTTIDLGGRYGLQVYGRDATLRLQLLNVTDEHRLTPSASGMVSSLASRHFDVSIAFDI